MQRKQEVIELHDSEKVYAIKVANVLRRTKEIQNNKLYKLLPLPLDDWSLDECNGMKPIKGEKRIVDPVDLVTPSKTDSLDLSGETGTSYQPDDDGDLATCKEVYRLFFKGELTEDISELRARRTSNEGVLADPRTFITTGFIDAALSTWINTSPPMPEGGVFIGYSSESPGRLQEFLETGIFCAGKKSAGGLSATKYDKERWFVSVVPMRLHFVLVAASHETKNIFVLDSMNPKQKLDLGPDRVILTITIGGIDTDLKAPSGYKCHSGMEGFVSLKALIWGEQANDAIEKVINQPLQDRGVDCAFWAAYLLILLLTPPTNLNLHEVLSKLHSMSTKPTFRYPLIQAYLLKKFEGCPIPRKRKREGST
jgi:hypothetical protein